MVCTVVLVWTLLCDVGLWYYLSGWIMWLPQRLWGGNIFRDMGKESLVLVEMGLWECFLCVWEILTMLSLVVISMARTKNTGQGKAASSSME